MHPALVVLRATAPRSVRARALRAGVVAAALLVLVGCDSAAPREVERGTQTSVVPTPDAEFVISAGDSTFWVRSGPNGVAVRGSPILLARLDGRFYELYVTDDDRSFRDAVFVGQQLWKRDVVSNDSSLVWADTTVPAFADAWAAANPGDRPLAPGEPESADPMASAITELTVLDVVGPYLSLEWFADVHPLAGATWHRLRREVLDLRTGRSVPLAELLGARVADELAAAGGREFARRADSIAATAEDDQSSGTFAFDATSFALGVEAGRPSIAFLAPAIGDAAGDAGGLPLDPFPVVAPSWWATARIDRAEPGGTAFEDRWRAHPGVQLVARYDSIDGHAQLALLTTPTRSGSSAGQAVAAADAPARVWPLVRVTPPLLRVYWLDEPAVTPAVRRALARAFDEADRYESDRPFPSFPGRLALAPALPRLTPARLN